MAHKDSLNPRARQVLTALVDHYIVRAEPVSSKVLSQSAVLRASSATIRNTLADLEERGFVAQPHTSSGRLPTDRGYRTYVDELMHPEPLRIGDRQALDGAISLNESAEARMAGAARSLADQSGLLGLVVPPPERQTLFRKVSLIQIEEGKIAVILANSNQEVRSLLVDAGEVSIFRLEAVVKRMNEQMRGVPVSQLNGTLGRASANPASDDEKSALDLLGRSILKLSQEKTGDDIFISGAKQLLNLPDFAKIEDIGSIFELLDSKVTLVHFLRQREDEDGVHVTIGEERRQDGELFRSLSLVTAAFRMGGSSRGMVGVLGPKRIPYARLVPMVSYAAQRLSPPTQEG